MSRHVLPRTYGDGEPMIRVQAFISEKDYDTLFNKTIWIRGGQDRVISRLLFLFAELLRKANLVTDDFDLTAGWEFLNNLTLTSHTNGNNDGNHANGAIPTTTVTFNQS